MAKHDKNAKALESSTAPMFHDYDYSGVAFPCNAHPEIEYEDRARLRHVYPHLLGKLADNDITHLKPEPPVISAQVKGQVLTQTGTRVGTMTFNSVLTPSTRAGGPEAEEEY